MNPLRLIDFRCFITRTVAYTGTLLLMLGMHTASAEVSPEACNLTQERSIAFSAPEAKDTLRVHIYGESCSEAEVDIVVVNDKHQLLYQYTGELTKLMPYKLYEPELSQVVVAFAEQLLNVANSRSTKFLPRYTNVDEFYEATNDFVVISTAEYESLRQQDKPIIWHATGDSSWVHLVYDPKQQTSRVIMRGGVFH